VERYPFGKKLGSGTYGPVFFATLIRDSTFLAIKVANAVEHASEKETKILESIHHPFIVSYDSSFIAKQKVHICRIEKRISLDEAKLDIDRIAFAELHKHSIIYRDLKPENGIAAT
jgi:serine/threonine protein kinase